MKHYFVSNKTMQILNDSSSFKDLLSLREQEIKVLTEKYKKLEEEFQLSKAQTDIKAYEEKFQILSKEIARLTELSNSQISELHECKKEKEALMTEVDMHKSKIQTLITEIDQHKIVIEKMQEEKKTIEAQKVYIQDNAESNEKIRALSLEIGILSQKLNEREIAFKGFELEKVEIFKSNEKLFHDVEHWKKEALRFESESKEIVLKLRTKEIEFEEFRKHILLQLQEKDRELSLIHEEAAHWKASYDHLFYQELPRLHGIIGLKENQPMPPPMIIERNPQPPPHIMNPAPPPVYMENHEDSQKYIKKLEKKIKKLKEKLEKKSSDVRNTREEFFTSFNQNISIQEIEDLKRKIQFFESELLKKDQYIIKIQETIREIENERNFLKEKLSSQNIYNSQNSENIYIKNQQEIKILETQIEEKNQIIFDLKAQIALITEKTCSEKDKEIKILHLQIEEKNKLIMELKTNISTHVCKQHTSINSFSYEGKAGNSHEFYKLEVSKLQIIIKEKNQEIQNLRLQIANFQKTLQMNLKYVDNEKISLLEQEIEMWKTRFAENMTINMRVKEEITAGADFLRVHESPQKEKIMKQTTISSSTALYQEKINHLKTVLETKEQEILLWKKKYEDLTETYRRLEMSYEKEIGQVITKETIGHDFIYENVRPSHYLVQIEQDRDKKFNVVDKNFNKFTTNVYEKKYDVLPSSGENFYYSSSGNEKYGSSKKLKKLEKEVKKEFSKNLK